MEQKDKEDTIRENWQTYSTRNSHLFIRDALTLNVHKNTVKDYLMAHGHEYDAFWLQALAGQGRLYCQIIVRSEDLLQLDDADEPDIVLLNELEEDSCAPIHPKNTLIDLPSPKCSLIVCE